LNSRIEEEEGKIKKLQEEKVHLPKSGLTCQDDQVQKQKPWKPKWQVFVARFSDKLDEIDFSARGTKKRAQ